MFFLGLYRTTPPHPTFIYLFIIYLPHSMKKCSIIQVRKRVLIWRGGKCVNSGDNIGEFFTFFHRAYSCLDYQRLTECSFIPNRKLFVIFVPFSVRFRNLPLGIVQIWP